MASEPVSYKAGGDIHPMIFVTPSATLDNVVVESIAGDRPCGVSQKGNRYAPWPALDDGLVAKNNENVGIFVEGQVAPVRLGGTVAAHDLLKPTTAGKAITASSDGDWYGGEAAMAGVADQIIPMKVRIGQRGGTN